jgi:phage/plasmid-associated DNA primase
MKVTFTSKDERGMLTDWLAWCLQNESDKPGWEPFLFSAENGSGKSTFAKVAGLLFGDQNTATENNINKLVSRFNAPVLEKKLVICEELYLPPVSDKANSVKTFITEKDAVVEHKY